MTSDERREPTIDELSEMVSKIIGTELVTIAKNAPSPRQAALLASHFGYNKDMIQATRWAAIIKRGERSGIYEVGTFEKILGPRIIEGESSYDIKDNKTVVEFKLYDPISNRLDALNHQESFQLLNDLRKFLYTEYGNDVHIVRYSTPRKSRFSTSVRWGGRHG